MPIYPPYTTKPIPTCHGFRHNRIPREKIDSVDEYLDSYAKFLRQGIDSVDRDMLKRVCTELTEVYRLRRTVWFVATVGPRR
jgi:hypothetical protein